MLDFEKGFYFLPLGGSDEIGMNLSLYCYKGTWIIVDCGVSFNEKLGAEITLPDISFIKENDIDISAIIATHAHEDHIGAIPYLWPYLNCPIYATPFTAAVIEQKIETKSWRKKVKLIEIPLEGRFDIKEINVEYVTLTHSIPEPNAVVLRTNSGTIVHTGDWKIDPKPLIGKTIDQKRLTEIGDEGVLALVCDSTNVFCNGTAGSEATVREEITKLIGNYKEKRLTFSCFASNIARMETIVHAAKENGRKVALLGLSLHRMSEIAGKKHYLTMTENIIDIHAAAKLKPEEVLFISTGSQGEPRSALSRIAYDQHPSLSMGENDLLVFSSRVIPGNENSIADIQNKLIRKGVKIITAQEGDIHVSGHPSRDDLKQMYNWTRPEVLIPVHGDAKHLYEHFDFAKSCGLKNIVIPENGAVIELSKNAKIVEKVRSGRCCWDANELISYDSVIFHDREKLAENGVIFITVSLQKGTNIITKPCSVTLLGLVEYGKSYSKLVSVIQSSTQKALRGSFQKHTEREKAIRSVVRRTIDKMIGKRPLIEVHFESVK